MPLLPPQRWLSSKYKLVTALWILLSIGFLANSLISYFVSRDSIRQAIIATELPLTSDNVYSEIQKDLVRPILISSMMARDTFLRDWVLGGEKDVGQMTRYLQEILAHYGAFTSFFVSDSTRVYYQAAGVLKTVRPDEPRDTWYFRVRQMKEPYEINVDPDMANRDKLTIFINYRVFDYDQKFIGATGVGLTVDAVTRLINDYQQRYGRSIYFVNPAGTIVLAGQDDKGVKNAMRASIRDIPGLSAQADAILRAGNGSFSYEADGHTYYLNARYIPELKWHLFVVKQEDSDLAGIQRTLYLNLAFCAAITLIVLLIVYLTINRYQKRLEQMATTDGLTGLANRHALDLLLTQAVHESERHGNPMSAIMFDVDHFKEINDRHGHLIGDSVLQGIAAAIRSRLRASDIVCRWGGEEFLVILKNTEPEAAGRLAEDIRQHIGEKDFPAKGNNVNTTVSAGVAAFRPDDVGDGFISRADQQLYRAKAAGRNCVCCEADETMEFTRENLPQHVSIDPNL